MTQLPDLPQNASLLAELRARGVPRDDLAGSYEGWELHTHPDLIEHFQALAPPDWPVLATFGVPVLAAKGIAAAVARGTNHLTLRLPEPPPKALEPAAPWPPLTDPDGGWYAVPAWPSGLHWREADRLLSLLVRHALTHAASLSADDTTDWRGRPLRAPASPGDRHPAKPRRRPRRGHRPRR